MLDDSKLPSGDVTSDVVDNRMNHLMHSQLADDAIDAYVAWREERAGVWHAYRRWSVVSVNDARSAFAAYQAALEREEKASWVYAELVSRLENALEKSALTVASDTGTLH